MPRYYAWHDKLTDLVVASVKEARMMVPSAAGLPAQPLFHSILRQRLKPA